ncbi:MAG TPA: response regulator [Bryobacteraceae bacterium]|nr:response regulator [Bryobacteraceae bacterium]HPU74135.1 response regulator [Bryobacteraceae bacterium]
MDKIERLAGRLAHGFSRWAPHDSETHDEILKAATLVSELTDELASIGFGLASTEPADTPARRPQARTALVVDECEESRRALNSMLQDLGYEVLEAPSAGDALLILERHSGPIEIMLTDVVMQEMSGRELAEHAALLKPEMRVIHMSGYTDAEIMYWGLLGPGLAALQKPVTAEALSRSLSEIREEQYA